nr:methyl-accepting chemotaxis protein [Natroniella sulfidigena]
MLDLKIKNKLVVLLLLITLLPIIIINLLGNGIIANQLEENFIEMTTREIRQVNNNIDLYFSNMEDDLRYLASNPLIRQADETITDYLDQTEEDRLQLTPEKNGGIEAEIYDFYLDFAEAQSNLAYVYLATTEGGYIQWPATQVTPNYDPRDRDFYRAAMENKGEVGRTEPYYWEADGTVNVSTVLIVEDERGEVIGVQGTDMSLDVLTEMIEDITIGETGYIVMTTEDGTILTHPRQPELNFEEIEKLGVKEFEGLAEVDNASYEVELEGDDYLANIYTSPELGWKFIALMERSELMGTVNRIRYLTWGLVILFIIIIFIIAQKFSNKFTKPIIAAAEFAQRIADADLQVDKLAVESEDEVGILSQALNQMHDNLKQMVENLAETVDNLSAYSQQLSASAEEGNATIETNNQLLLETSSGIEEISAGAQEVSSVAQEATSKTDQGVRNVTETIKSIEEIDSAVTGTVRIIDDLDNNAGEIGKIINLITNIAEQTNLLALNAAIEAARAGEEGHGFAVVADEIRELAAETAQATDEIAKLVNQTQQKSEEGLEAIEMVAKKAKIGKDAVQETGDIFTEIKDSIEETASYIEQTASSTHKLAQGSKQMELASDDVSNMSEEIAKSSQELAGLAQQVQRLIQKFRL